MTEGFDPNRSQVSEDTLAKFLSQDVQEDITSVPGIGPAGARLLAASTESEVGVQTTWQLFGVFLKLKGPGMTSQEHCDAFWHWLAMKGVKSHRSGIVHAVAERVDLAFPGVYSREA